MTWTEALNAAAGKSYNGMTGHLVTITSAEENSFLSTLVQQKVTTGWDNKSAWIAASDAATEGQWKWMAGPEAGTLFWNGNMSGAAVNGSYNAWVVSNLRDENSASGSSGSFTNPTGTGSDFGCLIGSLASAPNWDDTYSSLIATSNSSSPIAGSDGVRNAYVIEYENLPPLVTSGAVASTPENVSATTAVYTATATDPDAGTTLAYSIAGGADAALFNINTSTGAVTFKASPNFEAPADAGANNVYDITLRAYDGSLYADKAVAISVTDVNEANSKSAPTITSVATASVLENISTTTAVYTVTATDPDTGTTLTYSIASGADAALFNINASTGAVTFKSSPNFEAPADAGANNIYDITVRASDGTLYADKAVAITVTDVSEGSSSASLSGMSYFWKANASGQHALLSGVTVNAAGSSQPSEGANAPIQLKNISWDASGHATADIYAHVTGTADSFDVNLDLGGATGVTFTTALSGDWTLLNNQVSSKYFISGYSMTSLGAGDVKLGSIAFETGQLAQMHIGVDAGTRLSSVNATAYGYTLAHDTSGSSGAYSITPIDAGSYALTASRGITDIGAAINSADALAALKIAVSMNPNPTTNGSQLPVSPFQIMAADLNGDGRVNSADALAILKVAVHLSTAVTPQWVFVEDTRDFYDENSGLYTLTKSAASWDHTINATVAGDTAENLVGVLMGDVNGSWTPPTGSQYVETLNPSYFTDLSNLIHTPVSEWGVL